MLSPVVPRRSPIAFAARSTIQVSALTTATTPTIIDRCTTPAPFSAAMIVFACGWILYDTSNVLHHYRIGQHVAASLALFASVALLFWYVLRLVMALTSRD